MPSEWNTADEAEILEQCQLAIDYRFRQPEMLRAALTHTSGATPAPHRMNASSFLETRYWVWFAASNFTFAIPIIRKGT